jgi:ubiquinone/menaquinone biosynthesis C-methylase UbiE
MTQENLKNIDYWERLLENSPESYKKWFKEEKKYLQENIDKDSKVLEVGCGEGRSLRDILEITKNLTGIDNDKKAVEDAKKNFRDYSSVNIILADAEKLPFEDNSFDFILCMTTFANLGPKKFKALEEMKRVVKDNGKIIISVYSENALEERMKIYEEYGAKIKENNNGKIVFDEGWEDNFSEQFSESELREIFNQINLKIKEIKRLEIAYICKLEK